MNKKFFALFLMLFIFLRGLSLPYPALIDPTEGRYAAISKHLVSQPSWVMPEINRGDGNQPFWGKPPMFFWLSAESIKTFGVTNTAARLVSFFSSILILFLTYFAAEKTYSHEVALNAVAFLASSLTFYFLAGSSTIDVLLTLSVTGGLSMFLLCVTEARKLYGIFGFVFLALAMLTKGPIGVLFVLVPLVGWIILSKNIPQFFKIPWISGAFLFVALSLPWFLIAEQESPGLLRYFFVNEHFLRFISSDYGDKYGSSHPTFRGFIWILAFGGFLPWVLLLLPRYTSFKMKNILTEKTQLYFLLWALTPLAFFSPAKTVLFTYVLPTLPGLAVFLAGLVSINEEKKEQRILRYCHGLRILFILIALMSFTWAILEGFPVAWYLCGIGLMAMILSVQSRFPIIPKTSALVISSLTVGLASLYSLIDRSMSSVDIWREVSSDPEIDITFVDKLPYSAQYYAGDRYALKLVEPENIDYGNLKGDYIFSSAKKVDPRILEHAKTSCSFGKWVYLDLENEWSCSNVFRLGQ